MYDRILVPTDGSRAADASVEHAVRLAAVHDAEIHALFVVDGGTYSTLEAGAEMVIDALEREGRNVVGRIESAAADAGVDCETAVVAGTAYRKILEYADDNRAADVPVLTIRTGSES